MKKRSRGEGSFSKLPSGNWVCRIMIGYDSEGKRIIKSFTAPTKAEAREKMIRYMEELEANREAKKKVPFSEWADVWYKDHRTEVEASTYWIYGFTLKLLKDHFKNTPIQDIKQLDINRFLDKLIEEGKAKSTIGKCKTMLGQIFTSAVNNDILDKNVVSMAKKVKLSKTCVYEKDAFTGEERQAIREYAPDDLLGNSINALIGTGLRVQELMALRKEDIAEDGSLICVNKAVKTVEGQPVLGTTKSAKGKRMIPVIPAYRKYVLYLREHGGSHYIWESDRENHLCSVPDFRNRYKTVMKKIPGIVYRSPHCCRHTYITMLQAEKVPMDLIGALVGHSDITTTLGYTHVSVDTLVKVVDELKDGA